MLADSTADFSGVQGANHWYYGYFPQGDINGFVWLPVYNAQAQWWQHTTFGPPWTVIGAGSLMHPTGPNDSAEEWVAREWVSNYTGQVQLTGHLAKYDTNPNSDGIYARIYWNHQLIYQQYIAGTDGTGVNYSLSLTINAGDTLDFSVAPNLTDSNDATDFSATISSLYDYVTVDFSQALTVKSASGLADPFLTLNTGNADPSSPPASVVAPLQIAYSKVWPELSWYNRMNAVSPGAPLLYHLSGFYGSPADNYGGRGAPWLNWAVWESFLQNVVTPLTPLPSNVMIELWNEPDDGWEAPTAGGYHDFWDGTQEQFFETYLHGYQTLNSLLGASLVIAGPGYAVYDPVNIQAFLEYCLANGCQVNALTWHELWDGGVTAMSAHMLQARTMFLDNPRYAPLHITRIDVNEIVGSVYTHQPAGTLAYYQQFELGQGDGACRSCWTDSAGGNECGNGTADGLLTAGTFQPRGVWHAQKAYSDGVAGRVQSTFASPNVVALASNSTAGPGPPQILLGYADYPNTVAGTPQTRDFKLNLQGLNTLPFLAGRTGVDLQLELIPDTGELALPQPVYIEQIAVPLQNSSAEVDLPTLSGGDVFRITIVTPASGAACSYQLSPDVPSAAAKGGTVKVTVTTSAGCAWQAISFAGFVTIQAGSTGSNSGSVTLELSPNTSAAPRNGIVGIGDQALTLNQAGSRCDINQDGSTNLADVQLAINQALGVGAATADLDNDHIVSVTDIQMVIGAVLNSVCLAE